MGASRVLLVEGLDDLHAVAGLFRRAKLTERLGMEKKTLSLLWNNGDVPLDIVSAGGIEEARNFDKTLRSLDYLGDCKSLALVVDADDSAKSRWNSIATKLRGLGYAPPISPEEKGTIVTANTLRLSRVGVWVMPDNRCAGMLETFLANCVPGSDSNILWKQAVSATTSAMQTVEEHERFKDVHLDKAMIHSYLAWTNPPGLPLGQAIVKGALDHDSDIARVYLHWVCDALELDVSDETK